LIESEINKQNLLKNNNKPPENRPSVVRNLVNSSQKNQIISKIGQNNNNIKNASYLPQIGNLSSVNQTN
jgi:hypothetical protein